MGEIINLEDSQRKTKVKITTTGNGYRFEFQNGIEVDVSRIHDNIRDESITAELVVTSSLPATPHLVGQDRVNFTSPNSKKVFRTELEKRIESDFWQDILSIVYSKTLELHRRGEPVQEISTEDEITKPEYLLYPLLIRNHPTILFGLGGTGKGYLALISGIVMMLPMAKNKLGLHPGGESIKILYLDNETDKEEITWRLKCLGAGLGLGYLSLEYRRCSLPLADDLGPLKEIINQKDIQCLIIDSLAGACGGDLNAPEHAIRFFMALRQLKVTTLILAHTSKNSQVKENTPFGSVFFTNFARSIWEVKRIQNPDEDIIEIGLFHRKSNFSRLFSAIGFQLTFGENEVSVSRKDVKDIPGLAENLPNSQRVFQLLIDQGKMTTEQIEEETGIKLTVVRTTLTRLKRQGKVENFKGQWGALIPEGYLQEKIINTKINTKQ